MFFIFFKYSSIIIRLVLIAIFLGYRLNETNVKQILKNNSRYNIRYDDTDTVNRQNALDQIPPIIFNRFIHKKKKNGNYNMYIILYKSYLFEII